MEGKERSRKRCAKDGRKKDKVGSDRRRELGRERGKEQGSDGWMMRKEGKHGDRKKNGREVRVKATGKGRSGKGWMAKE